MKKEILKIANVRSEKEFYKLFPDEDSFMKTHGKQFKKLLLNEKIKKAQAGTQQAFNQQNVGMNNNTATQADVQAAISNIPAAQPKQTTGQVIEGVVKDIPLLGSLVSGIVGLFGPERKMQVRAGALSDLQLRASQSKAKPEPRKYVRPDMEAGIPDVNSLFPAEGTGSGVLAKNGAMMTSGGEIANTFAPNTIYSQMGYEPLGETERLKSYYYGGQVPQASFGSIVSGILGSSGGGSSVGGLIGNIAGGLLGGGQTTVETTTVDPSRQLIQNPFVYNKAEKGDWIGKIFGGEDGGVASYVSSALTKGENKTGNLINNPTLSSNIEQGAQTLSSGISAIPGMDTKMAQSSKKIGEVVGTFIPIPGASPVLGLIGQGIGAIAEDKSGKKAKIRMQRNLSQMASAQAAKVVQNSYKGLMEDGGWISHDWQPQVITRFGEHSVNDLLKKDPTMDTLRTGGSIRQNSDMENKGELKILWGGHAEPISYNPYLPDGGETVMFKGNSHEESDGNGRTGIGVKYGEGGNPMEANVEVENEPAVQLPDESGEKNLVIFGRNFINNEVARLLNDPEAKNKTVKKYVNNLSITENKQNKIMEKTLGELQTLDPKTPFEKIKFDTLSLILKGADQKLKDIAIKKNNVAYWQQFHNEEAERLGVDSEQLSRGKIKAMKGAKVPKARNGGKYTLDDFRNAKTIEEKMKIQNALIAQKEAGDDLTAINDNRKKGSLTQTGVSTILSPGFSYKPKEGESMTIKPNETIITTNQQAAPIQKASEEEAPRVGREDYVRLKKLYEEAKKYKGKGYNKAVETFQKEFHKVLGPYAESVIGKAPLTNYGKANKLGKVTKSNEDGIFGERTEQYGQFLDQSQQSDIPRMTPLPAKAFTLPQEDIRPISDVAKPTVEKERPAMPQFFNPLSPYLPSNKEMLDPRQLTGEYFALATNQLEPVPAQLYHPDLKTPYEISLQDVLNENIAATRSAQRMMGYNPAAQANLLAQQYAANQKVLGEQFRINQEIKDKVYSENIDAIRDAQLKNLGILDTQYQRQAGALSKTKDVAREALSSISDKYLQHELQNKTLATYENLYNYRFDPNQRAWNMNAPASFNMTGSSNEPNGWSSLTPEQQRVAIEEAQLREAKKAEKKRNGAILKAMRNL